MAAKAHCHFCKSEINPDADYRQVKGWVRRRAQGGANAIRGREPVPDVWACRWCVDKIADGVSPAQGGLL